MKKTLSVLAIAAISCSPAYGSPQAKKVPPRANNNTAVNPFKQNALKILRSISNVCDGKNTVLLYRGYVSKVMEQGSLHFSSQNASSFEIFNLKDFYFSSYEDVKFDQVSQLNNGISRTIRVVMSPHSNLKKREVANRLATKNRDYKALWTNEKLFPQVEYYRSHTKDGSSKYERGAPVANIQMKFVFPAGSNSFITKLYDGASLTASNDPNSDDFSSRLSKIISSKSIDEISRPSCDEMTNNPSLFQGIYAPDKLLDK